jgi:hypothetical protein
VAGVAVVVVVQRGADGDHKPGSAPPRAPSATVAQPSIGSIPTSTARSSSASPERPEETVLPMTLTATRSAVDGTSSSSSGPTAGEVDTVPPTAASQPSPSGTATVTPPSRPPGSTPPATPPRPGGRPSGGLCVGVTVDPLLGIAICLLAGL